MNPERFDALTRLWAAAPSRRAFVQQVGAMFAFGAIGRLGIRFPKWGLAAAHEQCYPERDGMLCGECGICQRGECIPNPANSCQNFFSGAWAGQCGRCRPKDLSCVFCGKRQVCCKDGCCDGPCSADGACCPTGRTCGSDCCRGCDVCKNGKCEKPEAQTVCPPNFTLIDGCCVCVRGLCGDQCCVENETCLDGRCCKLCGKDRAVCCDGAPVPGGVALERVCCRERCQDANKKCCPCMEDVPADEGDEILKRANETVDYVKQNNITYGLGRGDPAHMDCTDFASRAVGERNTKGSDLVSRNLDGNCDFRRLGPGESPRAGDVLAQPRSSGPPGSQHVGISQGGQNANGGQLGVQMGGSGPKSNSVWGLPQGDGGWFEGGDELHAYRPQRRKVPCKE